MNRKGNIFMLELLDILFCMMSRQKVNLTFTNVNKVANEKMKNVLQLQF